MKKIITGLLFITVTATAAIAQHHPEHHKMGHHKNGWGEDKMMQMKQLDLSDAQKQKMKSINEDFRKKMQELNSRENITVKEQRDRKTALMKDHKTQMDAVLTTEQKAKLEAFKTERKEKEKQMQEKRFEKMKTDLGLTEEQSGKIKKINEDFHSKLSAIKNNESLDRTKKAEQLKALKAQHEEQFKNVLTAEQQEKMKSLKKDGKRKEK